jgi:hypothetical protein
MSAADIEKLLATVQAGASQQQKSGDKAADKAAAAAAKEYKFWSTQPVPRIDETPTEHGPIERKSVADVATDPYPLPTSFEWDSIDMTVEANVKEVYSLLYENYVEDDDNMFRFDYSADFLKWALMPPGFRREWHVGVRSSTNKKLVAFISGIPQKMRVYKDIVPMVSAPRSLARARAFANHCPRLARSELLHCSSIVVLFFYVLAASSAPCLPFLRIP